MISQYPKAEPNKASNHRELSEEGHHLAREEPTFDNPQSRKVLRLRPQLPTSGESGLNHASVLQVVPGKQGGCTAKDRAA